MKTTNDWEDDSVGYRHIGVEMNICEKCGKNIKWFKKHKCAIEYQGVENPEELNGTWES